MPVTDQQRDSGFVVPEMSSSRSFSCHQQRPQQAFRVAESALDSAYGHVESRGCLLVGEFLYKNQHQDLAMYWPKLLESLDQFIARSACEREVFRFWPHCCQSFQLRFVDHRNFALAQRIVSLAARNANQPRLHARSASKATGTFPDGDQCILEQFLCQAVVRGKLEQVIEEQALVARV